MLSSEELLPVVQNQFATELLHPPTLHRKTELGISMAPARHLRDPAPQPMEAEQEAQKRRFQSVERTALVSGVLGDEVRFES